MTTYEINSTRLRPGNTVEIADDAQILEPAPAPFSEGADDSHYLYWLEPVEDE